MKLIKLIDKLETEEILTKDEWITLLEQYTDKEAAYGAKKARAIADNIYGKEIYIRGLIEFTNYCKNDCYYCGIRRSNQNADRYRLTREQILECCDRGWELGYRTFVLQGGEDGFYTDAWYEETIKKNKKITSGMCHNIIFGGTFQRKLPKIV